MRHFRYGWLDTSMLLYVMRADCHQLMISAQRAGSRMIPPFHQSTQSCALHSATEVRWHLLMLAGTHLNVSFKNMRTLLHWLYGTVR